MARKTSRKPTESEALAALFEPYVWAWFEEAFEQPSPPQAAAWPVIAEARNTLILSPTGSGKTLAAFLWCINELFRLGREGHLDDAIYVLYISPLKALNNDIQKNLTEPLQGIRRAARRAKVAVPEVRSAVRTGDTPPSERSAMARRPPHIFITTPESLFIILSTQKFRQAFRTVRYVIVDEIHALSDNKRGVHLSLSLERLQDFADAEFVRIGLSATQKPLEAIARFLVGIHADGEPRPCEIVDAGARKHLNVRVLCPVDNLLEAHYDGIWGSAYAQMIDMVRAHDTTLIFTNSRFKTERTALRLGELSVDRPIGVGAHHGSMAKEVRLAMEDRLKRGDLDALVATSSLELGIDVGSIDLVCQVQSPKSVSRGMQRIGRAGHLLHATSKGRLLVTDRDDLVECAVLVRAIVDGAIDTTRVPTNCLDVLAQHIVGAVAADDWDADALYDLCCRSWCFRELERADYDRVLAMLAGDFSFEMERAPFPKISWDKVNRRLFPERSARMIAFRASGTIPDVADYDVWLEAKNTKVGQLDEGFVEELRIGDIFILGSTAWQVRGIRRNRVLVEDVYGRAPTIPYWHGEHESRTADLGLLVGQFRRAMAERMAEGDPVPWLQAEYFVDENGARSITEYFREQQLVTGCIPSDRLVLVEHFRDELGQQQIVVHASFGFWVNAPWAMALAQAIEQREGFRPQHATADDGILFSLPKGKRLDPRRLLGLVTPKTLDKLLGRAVKASPVFASRFRHNAVRALLVLREYQGRKTPVWLQSLRASALLEACRECADFPVVQETLRECLHEALDVPTLRRVLGRTASGRIETRALKTKIPSPFCHSLLLLGQYGEMGSIPPRERRTRLMHLHRELLRQILDEETLRNLLDETAVATVEARLQRTAPQRRARDANELARVLRDLGDLVDGPDEELSLQDRVAGHAEAMLAELVTSRRAVLAPVPTAEMNRERWIATENFPLYRAAFAADAQLDAADRKLLRALSRPEPRPLSALRIKGRVEPHIERLYNAYRILRIPRAGDVHYVAAEAWIPQHILDQRMSREEARRALIQRLLRAHGPVTKYEVMERYGFPEPFVERALSALHDEGAIAQGEYVPTKSLPQWCHKPALEEIHRLTLNRLRKEMEPATPEEYADFLIRWQHLHPDTQLEGVGGLRKVIRQLQGVESYQALFERDFFPRRVRNYEPSMLDRLCFGGEVCWRRFSTKGLKRGQIGFGFTDDADWLVADPNETEMDFGGQDDDIAEALDAIRHFLAKHGPCFFDDIVQGTKQDGRHVLRALWRLVWNGEATTDCYESIRHANITSGLSECYDLSTLLGSEGVDPDGIAKRMLEHRKLDPTLGRWMATERIARDRFRPPEAEERASAWARLLLGRWGIVCRDMLTREVGAPRWRDIRRALARLELLGKVRRGLFVQGLAGEQYAWPEAVDALREAKLRHPHTEGDGPQDHAVDAYAGEPMVLLDSCEPANPFHRLFPIVNEVGDKARFPRNPHNYLVAQFGQPVLLYHQEQVRLLVDLTKERAEAAVRALIGLIDRPPKAPSYAAFTIRDWNGHPADVSPARHFLTKLGFVPVATQKKGFVYDGTLKPDADTMAQAQREMPEVFERMGKEAAPVTYDAEWTVSRSHKKIQHKVRELLEVLAGLLPEEHPLIHHPRHFNIRYRGVDCAQSDIGQKQVRLRWFHQGFHAWWKGTLIELDTDPRSDALRSEILDRLAKSRAGIDAHLDRDSS